MGDYINRLRRLNPRGKVSGSDCATGASDLPLDHRLSFSPEKDERWSFKDESRILLNDADVGEMIGENANDVGLLCGFSQGLYQYQQHVWSKGGKSLAKFNGVILSLQDTILGRLGCIYDGLTGGIRFECDGRDFWINNVNVRSVLSLYRLRPTDKARRYLIGLRDKLGLILSRQQSSTRYDGVHSQAREVFDEISMVLEFIPSDAVPRLVAGGRSS